MDTETLPKRAISFYRDYGLISFLKKGFVKAFSTALSGKRTRRYISRSKLLTTLYFYIRGTYYHEQKKLLNGQVLYDEYEEERTKPLHRRIQYTHIIEKGLSVPEARRRDTFGDYVVKTLVDDIQMAWEQTEAPTEDEQLLWTVDVLNRYFETTGENPVISKAEDSFDAFLDTIDYAPDGRIPRRRKEMESAELEYEQLNALANQRSSTRWFVDREVPRESLDKAVRVAAKSPSACNRQSFEFRIFDERDKFEDLLDHRIGTNSYGHNIPVLVALVGKQRAYKDDSERNTIFIDASLAAMSFQFALETLGLGSCMINWPMLPEEQKMIASQLDLDADEQVITLIAVGYPDPEGKVPYSNKKDLGGIRSYNRRA